MPATETCPRCRQSMPAGSHKCPHCGAGPFRRVRRKKPAAAKASRPTPAAPSKAAGESTETPPATERSLPPSSRQGDPIGPEAPTTPAQGPSRSLLDPQPESPSFADGPTVPTAAAYSSPASVRSVSAGTGEASEVRFVPGSILAGRYRVVGLLGRGGMGEVYRADDLRLGEAVALKFLPEDLARDGATLARFHREVKVARNVAHANLCRVYDIGEAEGLPFLSMEYIDGEDLAALQPRVGRLAPDRATEIARQLCAGLAAAHEQGVLHRDLKPANVMIDGTGRAKITDFGIAGLENEFGRDEISEGTPAYQSPEQLAGREVTARSDIYALGLVLYELFAGERAFPAKSRSELVSMQTEGPPVPLSSLAPGLDPQVEKAVARCLAPEPRQRPPSALQVAAMLPGGDPLAAAVAAGETPSPEMVAAAPRKGTLSMPVAALCLAGVVVVLLAAALLQNRVFVEQHLAAATSPSTLAFRAEQVADRLGLPPGEDRAGSWKLEPRALARLPGAAPGEPRGAPAVGWPPLLGSWYRVSPSPMETLDGYVRYDDPPLALPGDALLRLDVDGRLWRYERVPARSSRGPDGEAAEGTDGEAAGQQVPAAADWAPFFAEAGLDPSALTATGSLWDPPQRSDERLAWTGGVPRPTVSEEGDGEGEGSVDDDGTVDAGEAAAAEPQGPPAFRVEAASLRGEPVWFEVMEADEAPVDMAPRGAVMSTQLFWWAVASFYVFVLVASLFLARRNLRLGRGDRRGAFRVATVLFSFLALEALVSSHHVGGLAELQQLMRLLARALFWAAVLWLAYVALEPIIRRRWPERVIAWSRALAGDLTDPMVGREVLLGVLIGLAMGAVRLAAAWGLPLPDNGIYPIELGMWLPNGWSKIGQWLAAAVSASLLVPVAALLFIVLLTVVV
ncbi:MAG TPA: protein kinase, partial [Thermoanaerobaculia bacterium]|nr:protein kinase [Thermoanaerobaculia bacterium]